MFNKYSKTTPFISVIIPLFNKESVIKSSIESVIKQSYDDIEIIIVDDGSTDKSVFEAKTIADSRIVIISQINKGVSAARNTGIINATGKWILFLDADDILYPDALMILSKNIIDNETIIAGNFDISKANGVISSGICNDKSCLLSGKSLYKNLVFGKFFMRAGSFIIPSTIAKTELYDESLSRYEDMEVFLRWFKLAKVKYVPVSVMSYELGNAEASKPNPSKYKSDYGFNLKFIKNSFWYNCIMGDLLNITISSYPHKREDLIKKYGNNNKYRYITKILRYYRFIKNNSFKSIINRISHKAIG